MKDMAQSPGRKCSISGRSMDQVDVHQMSRDVATDPISFIDDMLYSAETQTYSPRKKA